MPASRCHGVKLFGAALYVASLLFVTWSNPAHALLDNYDSFETITLDDGAGTINDLGIGTVDTPTDTGGATTGGTTTGTTTTTTGTSSTNTSTGTTSTTGTTTTASVYPPQGNTTTCPMAAKATNLSTVSCPGDTPQTEANKLKLSYTKPDGTAYSACYYINNRGSKSYFVPLKTYNEWMAFSNASTGNNLELKPCNTSSCAGGDMIIAGYNCMAGEPVDAICPPGTIAGPLKNKKIDCPGGDGGFDFFYMDVQTCDPDPACGTTPPPPPPVTTPINGSCGSATTSVGTAIAPSTSLCATGTASSVSGNGPWTWQCLGSDGGSTASCTGKFRLCGSDAFRYIYFPLPGPKPYPTRLCMNGATSSAVTGPTSDGFSITLGYTWSCSIPDGRSQECWMEMEHLCGKFKC